MEPRCVDPFKVTITIFRETKSPKVKPPFWTPHLDIHLPAQRRVEVGADLLESDVRLLTDVDAQR